MKSFALDVDCSRGTLAIGGYSPTRAGMAAVYAQDEKQDPIVPATALRGALRITLEALLRGDGQYACEGGHRCGPGTDGVPCLVCQIFGGEGETVRPGQRAFASLVLGDARLCEESEAVVESLRHGVAIARGQRSAAENQLWARLGLAPGQALLFRATGRILPLYDDPERSAAQMEDHARLLRAAVQATQHIGAGRSRGLGRVDLALRWLETPAEIEGADESVQALRLRVRLLSAASIGLPMPRDNLRETRLDIPGAALRGAVGFGLAEVLPDPADPAFQQLVSEEEGATFDFLYSVDPAQEGGPAGIGPWPRTARSCKVHPYRGPDQPGHGLWDALCDLLAIEQAQAQAQRMDGDGLLDRCPVQGCGASLEPLGGWRGITGEPSTRLQQRVRLNRRQDSAEDQALYGHVLIEAGQCFEGSIRDVPAAGRAHLARALRLPLSLGRGRHRGWGQVEVRVVSAVELPSIAQRREKFCSALRRRLLALRMAADEVLVERVVVLSLLSPLLLESGDGRDALAGALGCQVEWLHVSRRFGYERGWNQREEVRTARHSVLGGGVFVARLMDTRFSDVAGALQDLERQGVGPQRKLGFGRVLAFDPFFAANTPTQEEGQGHGH